MLPTIFETAPINYTSPRISNNDNLVPSPSFKELSSSRNKKIHNKSNNKMCGGEITVEDDKVYIPTRRVFDDNDDDDNNESSSMTTNINTVLQIDLDDIPDLPFDCPAHNDIMSSEQEELDDDDDDDIGVSVKNDINFVTPRPRPLLRSSTTPTDTSLSLLQRQQQHNDEVRKQARASLLYSSSSGSPRSVRCSNLSGMTRDAQSILGRPAAA